MPIRRTYGCKLCGATWQFLHMTRDEPAQSCPNGCMTQPTPELSAPSLNTGKGKPGQIAIPQSQSARETLAADLALKGTGMSDINTGMKPGDIAAKPLPLPKVDPSIPEQHRAALMQQITPGFRDYGQAGQWKGVGVADPVAKRNLSLFAKGNTLPKTENLPKAERWYPPKNAKQ